jgi:hypothetical protein
MAEETYVEEEHRVVHGDGWLVYVCDAEPGCVSIGYKDCIEGKWQHVAGTRPIEVSYKMADQLADAIKYLAAKRLAKGESI